MAPCSALSATQAAAGQIAEAAENCRRLLARDPLHEEAWRRLMTCHAKLGERNQALKLYQQLTELLARELDAEPDEETAELAASIGRGASLAPADRQSDRASDRLCKSPVITP